MKIIKVPCDGKSKVGSSGFGKGFGYGRGAGPIGVPSTRPMGTRGPSQGTGRGGRRS